MTITQELKKSLDTATEGEDTGLHTMIFFGVTHTDPRGLLTNVGPAVVYQLADYEAVNIMWRLLEEDEEFQAMKAEFYAKIAPKMISLGMVVQG